MQSSLDGILLVNKKAGITSYDVIRDIKRCFKNMNINTKIGHTGTLDPFAQGLLIILLGKYTRMSDYLMNLKKTYTGTFVDGESTDTLDIDGVINEVKPKISNEIIINNVSKMLGQSMQTPPYFSAVKHNGKKLYEYARKGEKVEKPPRKINVYEFEVSQSYDEYFFRACVSKGTYVRKLLYDYLNMLGGTCYLTSLKRESMGEFSVYKDTIDSITPENILNNIKTIDDIDLKYETVKLDEISREKLKNGIRVKTDLENKEVVLLKCKNEVFAFGGISDGMIFTRFFI